MEPKATSTGTASAPALPPGDLVACSRCPNDTCNPAIRVTPSGLCEVCQRWDDNFRPEALGDELDRVVGMVGSGSGRFDAMVGISGGKDSTAALVRTLEMGFTPLAFTFDTGYYPDHILPRARKVAKQVDAYHEVISLRAYIRPADRESFRLTAELYSEPDSSELATRFVDLYRRGRESFSIRNDNPMPYVRTCQLCRRLVVRAYHREATARGVRIILLGTNEWVGLSQNPSSPDYRFSGVRVLRPTPADPPVHVVHLPFLLRATVTDTTQVLESIGWQRPDDEAFIESSSNSCLLSRAAEARAYRMLGFHPDTTRLAREVTAGFLTRDQANAALAQQHPYPRTVTEVLTGAGIL